MAGIGSAVIAVKVLTWASIIGYIGVAGAGIFASYIVEDDDLSALGA